MSKIRLHGSSSGYTEIAPVAASGNNTLTLPNDGTIISKDAAGAVGVTSVVTTTATITTAKVGAAVTISESGIEASGIGITCANINGTQIGGRRNIIINGAMNVAQRGTSSTSAGIKTVDRFAYSWSGQDEAPTQEQVDVASGTTPYTKGFRKAYKVTNGNQTSGADASDLLYFEYMIEAQDIANSGWNYTSSSSNITLSFWVKSSVSQDFKGYIRTVDGTSQIYPYSTGTLSANTWTKITKTISGNSNLQFDNDTNTGLQLYLWPYIGTTYTDAGVTENAWAAYASGTRTPVSATTWWTTNDATFEITGVQLEVGSQATAFEHRSFAEESLLCKRYYQVIKGNSDLVMFGSGRASGTDTALVATQLAVPLRASPTIASINYSAWGVSGSKSVSSGSPTVQSFNATDNQLNMQFGGLAGQMTNARPAVIACDSGSNLTMDAEL